MRTDPNWTGALFSFLRVLAVALASALLPLLLQDGDTPVTWRPVLIAAGAAFLLTVINFFRDGETRFGTPPNPGNPSGEYGAGEVNLLIRVLVAVILVVLVVYVLTALL